jgi:hypothetical protein
MGSTEPQHTPKWPVLPLKPFRRPCKIFVTHGAAPCALSLATSAARNWLALFKRQYVLKRQYGERELLD